MLCPWLIYRFVSVHTSLFAGWLAALVQQWTSWSLLHRDSRTGRVSERTATCRSAAHTIIHFMKCRISYRETNMKVRQSVSVTSELGDPNNLAQFNGEFWADFLCMCFPLPFQLWCSSLCVKVRWSVSPPTISWIVLGGRCTGRRKSTLWPTRTCFSEGVSSATQRPATAWSSLQVETCFWVCDVLHLYVQTRL